MAEKKRIIWIDQLRGLAFYTVILGHMSIGKKLKDWLYSFHMPLFFMISGLNFNIQKVYNTSFKDYVLRLSKKMLVPYLWLQMFSFILRYMVNILGSHKEVPVPKYLLGILVGNNNLVGAPSNPLYYVLLLLLAQIGLWFVVRVAKGDKTWMGIILAVLSLGSVCLQRIDLPWHVNVVPTAMLLIYIGRLLMDCYLMYREKMETLNRGAYFGICAVLLAVGYVLNRYNGRISIHGNFYGQEYVIFLVCAVASSVAIAMLVMLLPKSKLLTFIGANTFFYMGIHKPLLLVMETVFSEYESHWIFLLVGSLVCFFGLAPVAWLANKFFPYTCGNSINENTILINIGKYVAVAVAGAVPYLYFNNHFLGGVLRTTVPLMAISAAIYVVLVVGVERLFTKLMPFMFLQDKK